MTSDSPVLVFLLFGLGLLCIIKGGDWFVDAASWIAEVSGIPQFIIGATIVSLATTLPEVLVSVMAAASGSVEMATGNAIGSVTANTGMILGISIVAMPAVIDRKKYLTKSLIFIGSIILLWALSLSGELTMIGAFIMAAVFIFFIFENVNEAKMDMGTAVNTEVKKDKKTVIKNIALFIMARRALSSARACWSTTAPSSRPISSASPSAWSP